MLSLFDPFREFTFGSVLARLLLSLVCGGVIGYGRERRNSEAGLRTYMQISLGAALSVIVTLYEYRMLQTVWEDAVSAVGLKFDASRLASQAITGIGFLAAGMIIKRHYQQVKGLTTATGMFATVCMSLAAGAGFVECVLTVLLLIVVVLDLLEPLEKRFRLQGRNLTLVVEMDSVEDTAAVMDVMERSGAAVHEVELQSAHAPVSAVFVMQLRRDRHSHPEMLGLVAELPCVRSVQEFW